MISNINALAQTFNSLSKRWKTMIVLNNANSYDQRETKSFKKYPIFFENSKICSR